MSISPTGGNTTSFYGPQPKKPGGSKTPLSHQSKYTPNMLMRIFGDAIIKDDPFLQGGTKEEMIDIWNEFLHEIRHRAQPIDHGMTTGQIDEAIQDFSDITETQSLSAKALREKIHEGLTKRGRFCLPLQYAGPGKQRGHVFVCLFEKGANGHIYAHILNKGEGSDLHPRVKLEEGKQKRSYRYYPIRLTNDDFFNPEKEGQPAALTFLNMLQSFSSPPKNPEGYRSQDIYELFVQIGRVCRTDETLDASLGVTTQRSGTCSEQVPRMIIRDVIGKKNVQGYKRTILSFKYATLKKALKQAEESEDIHPYILSACKHSFSLTVGKAVEDGWLSLAEQKVALALCDQVDVYIQKHPPQSEPFLFPSTVSCTLMQVEGTGRVASPEVTFGRLPSISEPSFTRVHDPKNVRKEIEEFKGNQEQALRFLEQFPIPGTEAGDTFWSQVTEGDLPSIVANFNRIAHVGLNHKNDFLKNRGNEVLLGTGAALAITDYLCRRMPELKLAGFYVGEPIPDNAPVHYPWGWQQARHEQIQAYFRLQCSAHSICLTTAGVDSTSLIEDFQSFNKQGLTDTSFQKQCAYVRQFIDPKQIEGKTIEEQLNVYLQTLGQTKHQVENQISVFEGDKYQRTEVNNSSKFYAGCLPSSFYQLSSLSRSWEKMIEDSENANAKCSSFSSESHFAFTIVETQSTRVKVKYNRGVEVRREEVPPSTSRYSYKVELIPKEPPLKENSISFIPVADRVLREKIYQIRAQTENKDLLKFSNNHSIPHELLQELFKLKDYPAMRVGGVLQLIELHPRIASEPDIMRMVEYCLFEKEQFQQAVASNPLLLDDFRRVIDAQIKRCSNIQEYTDALSWTRFGYVLETHAAQAQKTRVSISRREALENAIENIERTLNKSNISAGSYSCILHRLFLQIEEPPLSTEESLGKFYGLWVALNIQENTEGEEVFNLCFLVTEYVQRNYKGALNPVAMDTGAFFRTLGNYYSPVKELNSLTKGANGYFTDLPDEFAFDLASGLCYRRGVRVQKGQWPVEIKKEAEEFFPRGLPAVQRTADGVEAVDQSFRFYSAMTMFRYKKVTYEKKIDRLSNQYWQLIDESSINYFHIPRVLYQQHMRYPVPSYTPRCWVSLGSPREIWITDDQDQPEYKISQQGTVSRLQDGKVLYRPNDTKWEEFINEIWNKEETLIWGNETGPNELVFPRLNNLSFRLENTPEGLVAHSNQYHGYVLAKNQSSSDLGHMKGALILEKANEGKRLLILPCQNLESSSQFIPSPPKVVHTFLIDDEETRVLAYEVDSLAGKLRPAEGDQMRAYLYLIDILLREKEYEKANRYLEDLTWDRPLNQDDVKFIEDIIKNARRDPSSSAFVIRLILRFSERKIFFNQNEEKQVSISENILKHFHEHIQFVMNLSSLYEVGEVEPTLRLSRQEMRTALQVLKQCIEDENAIMVKRAVLYRDVLKCSTQLRKRLDQIQTPEESLTNRNISVAHAALTAEAAITDQVIVLECGSWPSSKTVNYENYHVTNEDFRNNFYALYALARRARSENPSEFDIAIAPYLKLFNSTIFQHRRELGFLCYVRRDPSRFPSRIDLSDYQHVMKLNALLERRKNIYLKPALRGDYHIERKKKREAPALLPRQRKFSFLEGKLEYKKGKKPLGKLSEQFFYKEIKTLFPSDEKFALSSAQAPSEMGRKKTEDLTKAHARNVTKQVGVFSWKENAEPSHLKMALEGRKNKLEKEKAKLKGAIEALANIREGEGSEKKRIHVHARALPILKLETGLLDAVLAQDPSYLKKLNPLLNDEQAMSLYEQTITYMLLESESDQVEVALQALSKGEAQECASILNRARNYDPIEHPLLLVYEYATGNMFREEPDQTALLLTIFSTVFDESRTADQKDMELRRLFFEFQAGGGKTKVIAAILAAVAPSKGKMPVFVSLPEIYDIAKKDLRDTLERVYSRKVETVDLRLGSHLSLDQLETFYEQCKRGLEQGLCQVMVPESYHALFLDMQRACVDGNYQRVTALRKILNFYREHAIFLIDESHRNVDSLLQANLALGTPDLLPLEEQEVFLQFYGRLARHEKVRLRENQQALVPDGVKKEAIKQVAKELLEKWGIFSTELLDCVTNSVVDPSCIESYQKHARALYLLRGLCTELVPNALSQVEGMDYGPSVHPHDPLDSPRRFKNPTTAKYEVSDVAATITVQGYYQRGVKSLEDRKKLLKMLQEEFSRQRISVKNIQNLPLYRKFLDWQQVEDADKIPIDRIDGEFLKDDEKVMALGGAIGNNSEVIEYFLKYAVLPYVVIFPYKYTSTAQDLVAGAFASVLFSATLGSKEQNPYVVEESQYQEDLSFQAAVMQRANMPHNQKIHWTEDRGVGSLLRDLYSKDPASFENLEGVINLGGFAKYESNEEWGREWLKFVQEKNLPFDGVLFKQEEAGAPGKIGEKVYYFIKKGDVKPFRLATTDIAAEFRRLGLSTERVIKIYGPDDTTGTDIPLSPKAKMLITVGEGTTSTALVQAIMRERQFLKAPFDPKNCQSLVWCATPSLKEKMEERIGCEVKVPAEIFLWSVEQDVERGKMAILTNAYHEIEGVYRQAIMGDILQGFFVEITNILSFFRKELGRNLKQIYGKSLHEVDVEEHLQLFAKELATRYVLPEAASSKIKAIIKGASREVPRVTLASGINLSSRAEQQQVQVQIARVEQKQQMLQIPQGEVARDEESYAEDSLALNTEAFWDEKLHKTANMCLETSCFPSVLKMMLNAEMFTNNRFLKPPDRLLLVGHFRQGRWEYEYRLVSLRDATTYQKQMKEKVFNPETQRIAILTITGYMETNGEPPISLEEFTSLQQSPLFQEVLTAVHFLNGKVYNEKVLKEMVDRNPSEWKDLWQKVQALILDKERMQSIAISSLFSEEIRAGGSPSVEVTLSPLSQSPASNESTRRSKKAVEYQSSAASENIKTKGKLRAFELEHDYIERKTHQFFFRRGLLRFLNTMSFGLIGFFVRRYYRKRWDAKHIKL